MGAYTEGVLHTYSWIPQLRYRYSLPAVGEKGKAEALKGREARFHIFFWIVLDKCNRRDMAGKSASFLPGYYTFSTSSEDIFKGKNKPA